MDAARFDELVRVHLPDVHRLAVRLCGSAGPAAEDVAQDALLRAARSWRSFRGDASFRTWLHRLTVNAWHDHRRRRRPDEAAEPLDDDGDRGGGGGGGGNGGDPAGPPAVAAERELAELVAARVSALPPRQRAVLVLVAYEGCSTAEAAAALETTEQNVRTTLHLARAKLREQLAGYLESSPTHRASAAIQPSAAGPTTGRS